MEFNQLKTFQVLATLKSFSKAAQTLHLTQPAVTLQVKNLEKNLGQRLFERSSRTLNLTPAGEVFLVYAQQIINLAEQAQETMEQFANQRGRLSIGAGTTTTIFRLPAILSVYHQNHPQVDLRIRTGTSKRVTELVLENAVDLGLVTTIDPTLNLHTIPVFEDQIWLIGPAGNSPEITMEYLEQMPLILFETDSGFRHFLTGQFAAYHFTPKVAIELESIEAIIRFVQCGLGLAFLPQIAVMEELKGHSLQHITVKGWQKMVRKTHLIYRRDKYLTWPVKTFLKQLYV